MRRQHLSKYNIYLSGAEKWYIDNANTNYPFTWRKLVEEWINRFGDNMKAINPCNYYSNYNDNFIRSDQEIRRLLLYKISKCDILLVNLDHIKDSVITLNEVFFADAHNIPIIGFYEYKDDKDYGDDRYLTEPWILDSCSRIETNKTTALTDSLIYIKNYYCS